MHIAGYVAACDIDDLDHMAKTAVLAVAARANRRTAAAWVSIGRVAEDLAVNYTTARRALNRAVDAGYLTVDKSPGSRGKWELTSRLTHEVPGTSDHYPLVNRSLGPSDLLTTKDVRRTSQERARAAPPSKTGGRARSNKTGVDPSPSSAPPPSPTAAMFIVGSGRINDWTRGRFATEIGQNGYEDDESCPDPAAIAATRKRHPVGDPRS